MRARFLTAVVTAAAVVALVPNAASAETWPPPGDGGGAYVDPDGDPTATAGDSANSGGGGESGGGGANDDACVWRVVIVDDFEFPVYEVDNTRMYSATGRWLERWCPDTGAVAIDGYFLTPEGGLVDPNQLAVDALESVGIEPPAIRTSPSENGRLYVQIPTWLWLEPSWWQTYEATADAGRVWSTVRATPVATTWSLGDGQSVSCLGPGTAWRQGLPEDATDCAHTYRTSSAATPGGKFHLEATVTFEISWTSNAADGGTLPAITRTSTRDVEVGEIQAIGTAGGQ